MMLRWLNIKFCIILLYCENGDLDLSILMKYMIALYTIVIIVQQYNKQYKKTAFNINKELFVVWHTSCMQ